MGLAAGGRMEQKIYPDAYGIETWDPQNSGSVDVHIVNSEQYREITGKDPPPSPVTGESKKCSGNPTADSPASRVADQQGPLRGR